MTFELVIWIVGTLLVDWAALWFGFFRPIRQSMDRLVRGEMDLAVERAKRSIT